MSASSSSKVNPDLLIEREKASFKAADFALALYGQRNYSLLRKLAALVFRNPAFDLRYLWAADGGAVQYLNACRLAEEVVKLMRQLKLNEAEEAVALLQILAGEDMFIMLHLTMFLPTLQIMCDDDQARHWVPLARDFRILGTYCQTELGHGSNVAGLETTAEFDESNDEWVLNTPNLQATKWWPGGIAKSCTHCVCMARLLIRGHDYGVHPFIVQGAILQYPEQHVQRLCKSLSSHRMVAKNLLESYYTHNFNRKKVRDLETHKSLPGVLLFHIGKKLGYNSMDNGGVIFKSVRIPRRHLLMRFSHVDSNGQYKVQGNRKLMYGTMTFTRKQIIMAAGVHLAKSVVIAIRYSAVRRQFGMNMGKPEDTAQSAGGEVQVLDYSTQQHTLFPLLAAAVAFTVTGLWMDRFYTTFLRELQQGDFSKLKEMHAVTSCLKATMSFYVAEGIERCRKACGGHGYMLASGISIQYANFVPVATYEGDRVVLSVQAARILLQVVQKKMMGEELAGAIGSTLAYVYNFDPFDKARVSGGTEEAWSDPQWLLAAFKRRSCFQIYGAAKQYATCVRNGMSATEALDVVKIEFTRLTVAHAHVLILQIFFDAIENGTLECAAVRSVWRELWLCLALSWCDEFLGEFFAADAFDVGTQDLMMTVFKKVLRSIRPNAVGIADAFWIPDQLLNSALGRYDGRVYEALMESTKLEALNKVDVAPGYYEHLQYILHPERRSHRAKL